MHLYTPTYFVGDTIQLKLKFEHEAHLIDVWANFEKEEALPVVKRFHFTASLRLSSNLRQLNRVGGQILSEALLEATVSRSHPLPGTYKLLDIQGLLPGDGPRENNLLSFIAPPNVRFQVLALPKDSHPKVSHWELGWKAEPPGREADS
jgi:hypothetical protein